MYYIHISREEKLDPKKISLKEWRSYIDTDDTMSYTNTITYSSPLGNTVTKSGGFYGIWKYENKDVVFTLGDGEITVVFDEVILQKARQIAVALDAIVYGDVGEEY